VDAGREAAFRAFYTEHARQVLGYVLRRCQSHADAQDAVAETFAVAWRRFEDIPGEDRSLPWLFAVARRVLANQRRGHRRREQLANRLSASQPRPGGVEPTMSDDVRTVLAALGQLKPQDREILLLAAWEGLSHAEIAIVLGCSENASAIRLHRARERLNQIYAKEMAPSRTQSRTTGGRNGEKGPRGRNA
jgi:RNA polymerase sigma-70 factor (ECF subfamily)